MIFPANLLASTEKTKGKPEETKMWADAQRDNRPAKYRWRPLFNDAKFRWHRLLECRAVTLPRCETSWNLLGCPKLVNWSQPLVGQSSPYYQDIRERYCCLTSLFRLSIWIRCKQEKDTYSAKINKWIKDAVLRKVHMGRHWVNNNNTEQVWK